MSRPKYPSDHRRWFKVREDILDDPALETCSADVFRFYIRLLAMLNRAKSRDGKLVVTRSALIHLSGRVHRPSALKIAHSGAEFGLYSASGQAGVSSKSASGQTELLSIHVSNWPEMQEFTPTPLREIPLTKTKTKTSKRVERSGDEQELDRSLVSDHPTLTTKRLKQLQAIKPGGVSHTLEAIACWYAEKHPVMVNRGIKNFSQAAGKWFQRVRPGEVQESVKWVEKCRIDASDKRITAEMAAERPEDPVSEQDIKKMTDALFK